MSLESAQGKKGHLILTRRDRMEGGGWTNIIKIK